MSFDFSLPVAIQTELTKHTPQPQNTHDIYILFYSILHVHRRSQVSERLTPPGSVPGVRPHIPEMFTHIFLSNSITVKFITSYKISPKIRRSKQISPVVCILIAQRVHGHVQQQQQICRFNFAVFFRLRDTLPSQESDSGNWTPPMTSFTLFLANICPMIHLRFSVLWFNNIQKII